VTTRAPEAEKHAGFVELFFDLVFVYAVTQLARFPHEHPDPVGWARGALLFALVWWAWTQYMWVATGVDLARRARRALMLLATVLTLFTAQGVSDAWGFAMRDAPAVAALAAVVALSAGALAVEQWRWGAHLAAPAAERAAG